jgi:lipopolysaccharide transport system permease protein
MMMLAIYWIVFGVIFGGSFGHPGETKSHYVLSLFCGLLLFELIASAVISAPSLMLAAPNLVTKVVFPVGIIPMAAIGSALVHLAAGFLPLFLLEFGLLGHIPLTALWLPLVVLPLTLYALGLTYLLAALGVFLRDLTSFVPPLVSALMFVSALLYPISAVPYPYRHAVSANPLAQLLEQARNVLVFGLPANLPLLLGQTVLALAVVVIGRSIFDKLKPAFADVL